MGTVIQVSRMCENPSPPWGRGWPVAERSRGDRAGEGECFLGPRRQVAFERRPLTPALSPEGAREKMR